MPTPTSKREATHERIVDVAARALRRNGYDGVGVADVMQQAGLTHGGFYAHFSSREAMLAEALEQAGQHSSALLQRRMRQRVARGQSAFQALVDAYLSDAHVREVEHGCVVAALGSEMHRLKPELLQPSAQRVHELFAIVQQALPAGATAEQAMVVASTLVGTLQLARALGPTAQGKAVLAAARDMLLAQYQAA